MQPVNGVDQAHDAATISSPPTEHSEDLPQLPEDLKVKLKEPLLENSRHFRARQCRPTRRSRGSRESKSSTLSNG